MTCHEARKLLYDRQISRTSGPEEDRATVFALAQAHLAVCLACNEYFELERSFLATVKDRIVPMGAAMPSTVLKGALDLIHDERISVHTDSGITLRRTSFLDRIHDVFKRR